MERASCSLRGNLRSFLQSDPTPRQGSRPSLQLTPWRDLAFSFSKLFRSGVCPMDHYDGTTQSGRLRDGFFAELTENNNANRKSIAAAMDANYLHVDGGQHLQSKHRRQLIGRR